jgi:predicted hydrolase (HD superfamily)
MIGKDEAIVLLKKYIKDENLIKNSIIAETLLREIAQILGKDEEMWGLTGLLHNIDYEYTRDNPERRGNLSSELLENLLPEICINAIKANNYMHTDYIPITALDKSLISVAEFTRFIITVAESMPSKHLTDVDLNILVDRFNDEKFEKRFNRNRIKLCEDIGLRLEYFFNISLTTLKEISDRLGL